MGAARRRRKGARPGLSHPSLSHTTPHCEGRRLGTASAPGPAGSEPWVRLVGESTDGSIDGYELFSARRALALLKTNLGRERLLELLHDEIEAGTAFLRDSVERSAGQTVSGTTTLRAHGISAAQFTGWLSRAFAREEVMIAGHPEHYSIHAEP